MCRATAGLICALSLLVASPFSNLRAATLDDVEFLRKIETYEATFDTTLVTQEGNRVPVNRGTRLNVAGFTRDEAFIISRTDRPNGFVPRNDIAPLNSSRSNNPREGGIREQTLEMNRTQESEPRRAP
jgi:hypothetical protein